MGETSLHCDCEFQLRFKAARLLARPQESIQFDGARKTASLKGGCVVSVDLEARQIVVSVAPTVCEDEDLLDSLAALPCEPCAEGEVSLYRRGKQLVPVAVVPIDRDPVGRLELQRVRAALEQQSMRLDALVKSGTKS
jgi:hypothetical protein